VEFCLKVKAALFRTDWSCRLEELSAEQVISAVPYPASQMEEERLD
jgi:hypothetical protein